MPEAYISKRIILITKFSKLDYIYMSSTHRTWNIYKTYVQGPITWYPIPNKSINDPKLWRKLYTTGCDEVETKYDLHET